MKSILKLIITISIGLVLMLPTAHADFRKAVDSYIARDGASLLKQVKKSTNENKTEGLLLFLQAMYLDEVTSKQSNLYEGYKDQRETTSTLKTILSEQQQEELKENLSKVVLQSNADTQYYFAAFVEPIFQTLLPGDFFRIRDEFIENGSYVASAWGEGPFLKSDRGEPYTQFILGLKHLNFQDYTGYGCDDDFKDPICQTKDEAKGYSLLRQALKTYESRGHDDLELFENAMCDLFQQTSNGNIARLRQAYTWCVAAKNAGSYYVWKKLDGFDLEELGGDLAILKKTLPDWMAEARKQVQYEGAPVFSYYSNDYMDFELDIYADGIVKVGVGHAFNGVMGDYHGSAGFLDVKKDTWMKVKPEKVKAFLADFKRMAADWELITKYVGFCDTPDPTDCMPKRYQATIRDKDDYRRFYFSGLVWYIEKMVGTKTEGDLTIKIGKVSALVERYFPTQDLRCRIGNSEDYQKACIDRDKRWTSLSTVSK